MNQPALASTDVHCRRDIFGCAGVWVLTTTVTRDGLSVIVILMMKKQTARKVHGNV